MPDTPAILTQNRVVGFKIHATDEFTEETIAAADCSRALAGDSVAVPGLEVGEFLRPVIGTGLDRDLSRPTTKAIPLSHSEEIILLDGAVDPPYAAPLMACGMAKENAQAIDIDAPSGTFAIGEEITDGVDKSAILVGLEPPAEPTKAIYALLPGSSGDFADGDTITGEDSAATADVASSATPSRVGVVFHPLSESTGVVPPAGTCKHYFGGKAFGAIVRGNAVMRFEENNPGVIDFSFNGPAILDEAGGGGILTEDPPADIALVDNKAPLAGQADFILDQGGDNYVPPIVPGVVLDVGHQAPPRSTTTKSLGSTGLVAGRIRRREATIAFAPEDVPATTHDFWERVLDGEAVRMDFPYGDPEAVGGKVRVHVYRTQYQGNPEDRDGVLAAGLTCPVRASGRDDWPFFLAHYKTA